MDQQHPLNPTEDKESSQTGGPEVISGPPVANDDEFFDGPPEEFEEPRVGAPYNPEPERELVRGQLAFIFVGLLAVMALLPTVSVIVGWAEWDELEGPLTFTFNPIVGIVGTVLGFYFGTRSGGRH